MCFVEVMQLLSLSHHERSLAHLAKTFFVCLYIEVSAKAKLFNCCASHCLSPLCTQSLFSVEVVVPIDFLSQSFLLLLLCVLLSF